MKIQKDVLYKPRDIARFKLIQSSRGNCSYNFVLDEINAGRLKADIRGGGKTGYKVVRGSELIRYRKANNLFFSPEGDTEEMATDVAKQDV